MLSLLVWWVAGATLANAVSAAIWTTAGMIVVFELIAGVRAKLTGDRADRSDADGRRARDAW